MLRILHFLTITLSVSALAGCSGLFEEEEKPLEGERVSVIQFQNELEPDSPDKALLDYSLPQPWKNDFWPQAGGYPNHVMNHLALNTDMLKLEWTASIGKGSSGRVPLNTQPIVSNGRVYTMDTDHQLTAFHAGNGDRLWRIDVSKDDEDDTVIGGGLAAYRGDLYITNGYDELISLEGETGKLRWRVSLPTVSRASPNVINGRVFVQTLDNRLLAFSTFDGSFLWDHQGFEESSGLLGSPSPAASRDIVVPAYSSGELYALRVENGSVAWQDNVSPLRRIGGMQSLSEIRGLPVIDRGLVVAISYAGRIVAIDQRTGRRVWQREIGGLETPWIAGSQIFVLTSENKLVSLSRTNGLIHWVTELPRFEDPEEKEGKIILSGPVLAGGRLFITGTDSNIYEITPQDGKIIRTWSMGRAVKIPPVVAGQTLYMLAEDGTLMAYR